MKRATLNAIIGASVLVTGCAQQADWWSNHQWSWGEQGNTHYTRGQNGPKARLASHTSSGSPFSAGPRLSDIRVADQTEIDLAGDVVRLRTHYVAALNDLREYYVASGDERKLAWCQEEIADVALIKPRPYIQDEAIAEFDLRAARSIAQADKLFDQALTRMQQGGYGQVAQTMTRSQAGQSQALDNETQQLVEAYDLLVELIDRYPRSDKIDDAAFCCGEIVKECFPNRARDAIRWYDRCVRWDPQTPHPAQLQIAVLYDFQLNDPAAALANYRAAAKRQGAGPDEVAVAAARIKMLAATVRTLNTQSGHSIADDVQPAGDATQDGAIQHETDSPRKHHEAVPVREMDPMTPVDDGDAASAGRDGGAVAARS